MQNIYGMEIYPNILGDKSTIQNTIIYFCKNKKKCVCLKWTGTIKNKMLTVGLQVIFSSLRLFVFFTIKIYSFVIKKMVLKKHTHTMTLVPADLGRPSGLKQTVLAYRIPPTLHVPQAVYSYSFFLSKLAFQISHTWKMTLVNKHVLTGE